MRVFSIGADDDFTEYEAREFEAEHEETVLQRWLEANPDGILEDSGILIIGREVSTNLGGFIDLLGLDRQGNVVVVELKRDRTPRDTIAQALEYAAYAERLDADGLERILRAYERDESLSLADQHRKYFTLNDAEAVAFNKDQRVVVVGQAVTPQIRQTATFLGLKGVDVTCVEFTFFQAEGGRRLLSKEIVVSGSRLQPGPVSGTRIRMTEIHFLESCDEHDKAVFSRILSWARRNSISIKWGRGFTAGVDLDGKRVLVCEAYARDTDWPQHLYTPLRNRASGLPTAAVPEAVIDSLASQAQVTGLFTDTGKSMKCDINRAFADAEVDALLAWLESVRQAIMNHGPETPPESRAALHGGDE
ncbi:endonuclease NucS domain-containing protein [Candidatus Palauibacter sp.]|uniref:endonuclease NucS domain-containing protein n=1 Tax=Candidatus Palauibacter sp. TaxID=3101350 RepID=UPI003AF2D7B4